MIKIITVCAARPNFMKIAPLLHAIKTHNAGRLSKKRIRCVLVHTGQHYDKDMSSVFFKDLKIPKPDYHLGVGSGSLAYQIGQTMMEFEKVLLKERPRWTVVVGDVNATLACSVISKMHGISVAHVEAGLRSGDWKMPEEINRVVTDRVGDLLLTPCRFSSLNLRREGVSSQKMVRVGNIMVDTLKKNLAKVRHIKINEVVSAHADVRVEKRPLRERHYAVVTLHRPSNVDDEKILKRLIGVFLELAEKMPVVFPVHPRTRKELIRYGLMLRLKRHPGFRLLKPLGYLKMLALTSRARVILTDSGGLQEEACVMGVPCLTMRENTERPVTLTKHGGSNRLVGTQPHKILLGLKMAETKHAKNTCPPRWDGRAARRILKAILRRSKMEL